MLQRILSLIPQKANGDFVHGEKKKFAVALGFKSGEIVSDWIAGRNSSYKNYLYQISDLYNVSVEWLKGETDIKEKAPAKISERDYSDEALIDAFNRADDNVKDAIRRLLMIEDK